MREFVPTGLVHFNVELFGGVFNALPGFVPFAIRHALDLIEAGDGVTNVFGIVQRFLALLGEGEFGRAQFILFFFIKLAHAYWIVFGCWLFQRLWHKVGDIAAQSFGPGFPDRFAGDQLVQGVAQIGVFDGAAGLG